MINITSKSSCCGCEACVQACPKHCITFEEDAEGFHYPLVDKTKCVVCGLCERVCPVINQAEERKPIKVYAAKNCDEQELLKSSSGGVFIILAKEIIRQGGIVFGAKFDDNWNVAHTYAEIEEDVKAFMGSKYVQSRIYNTYKEAKVFLDAGRQVLFTGTSCQIAGLKHYLRKEYDNLLTIDVVCHGVPSPKIWRKYLDEIKKNAGDDSIISDITFRDKSLGWRKYSFVVKTTNRAMIDNISTTISNYHRDNPYLQAFIAGLILRPSCEICRVKSGKCNSDITLADFWGIWNVKSELFDNKGTSLLMVNSLKGNSILEKIHLKLDAVDLIESISSNPAYSVSSIFHPKRKIFFKKFNEGNDNISLILHHYSQPTYSQILFSFMKRIKNKLKSVVKWQR